MAEESNDFRDSISISRRIAKSFAEDQQKFEGIEDPDEFLEILFDETYSDYSKKFLDNVSKFVKHKIHVEKFKISDIILFIGNNVEFETQVHKREVQHNFDHKFGTTTGIIIDIFDFEEVNSESDLFNYVRYVPSPLDAIHSILNSLKEFNVVYEDSIFIDIGSGLGRNLLVASEYPFKQIIGIELISKLHEIAEWNIKLYENSEQNCRNIKSICINVLDFDFPEHDNLILYFYNPFSEVVFADFFEKILDFIMYKQRKFKLIFLHVVYNIVEKSAFFKQEKSFQSKWGRISIYTNY